jgi:DNA-3-methyladenine glycosylase I
MSDKELESLLKNPAIIRNRLKVYAARQNARIFLNIQKEFGSFDSYIWAFVKGKPIVHHRRLVKEIPTSNPESETISKDLKKRGMAFVGPTIIYAFMQTVGLVNDHLAHCWTVQNQ